MNILMLCLCDPSGNPRPNRLIRLFNENGFKVDIGAHPAKKSIECHNYFEIPMPSKNILATMTRRFLRAIPFLYHRHFASFYLGLWGGASLAESIARRDYDYIFVADLQLLPLALKIRGGASVVLDAREFYPEQDAASIKANIFDRPYKKYICMKYLHQCDEILTVSPGLQKLYREHFGVECNLFRSLPYLSSLENAEVDVEAGIKLVHHGLANKNRSLELLIDIFAYLDPRYTLDFYLKGKDRYIASLRMRAAKYPNISFREPVEYNAIDEMLAQYDIGLCVFPPTTLNLKHCLPNKLFEFIQAGVAVVSGPSPDIGDILNEYDCGVVCQTFSAKDIANSISELSHEKINEMKSCSKIAAKTLCFEVESEKILTMLEAKK